MVEATVLKAPALTSYLAITVGSHEQLLFLDGFPNYDNYVPCYPDPDSNCPVLPPGSHSGEGQSGRLLVPGLLLLPLSPILNLPSRHQPSPHLHPISGWPSMNASKNHNLMLKLWNKMFRIRVRVCIYIHTHRPQKCMGTWPFVPFSII